jgi:hypothetical protein
MRHGRRGKRVYFLSMAWAEDDSKEAVSSFEEEAE